MWLFLFLRPSTRITATGDWPQFTLQVPRSHRALLRVHMFRARAVTRIRLILVPLGQGAGLARSLEHFAAALATNSIFKEAAILVPFVNTSR